MHALRTDLPPLPDRMKKLPVDERGFPVPYFVGWVGDKPDFRCIDPVKYQACLRRDVCWLCGELLGRYRACLIGPMCAITRTTSEPPSHVDCAQFAAKACPFLTRPMAKRNERELPALTQGPAGIHLDRNPGVICEWVVEKPGYHLFGDGEGGRLVKVHDPHQVRWWAQARAARRDEVDESIRTGLPLLKAQCRGDAREEAELMVMLGKAVALLPAA